MHLRTVLLPVLLVFGTACEPVGTDFWHGRGGQWRITSYTLVVTVAESEVFRTTGDADDGYYANFWDVDDTRGTPWDTWDNEVVLRRPDAVEVNGVWQGVTVDAWGRFTGEAENLRLAFPLDFAQPEEIVMSSHDLDHATGHSTTGVLIQYDWTRFERDYTFERVEAE